MSRSHPIRVASVPASHPYVAHLDAVPDGPAADARDVVRLPDPPALGDDGAPLANGRWWPPRMLEPQWLRDNVDRFDVLHVHFGFESFTAEHLQRTVRTAHELGKGVVVNVHDLRNPHLADERAQLDRLDVLVPEADAVITLTTGAASVIENRWGRAVSVVPHPHIVPLDALDAFDARAARAARRDGERSVIGIHLKSLRTNVDALGALLGLQKVAGRCAAEAAPQIVVTMHRAITEPTDRGYDADIVALVESLVAAGVIDLVLHEPMDDATLFAHVARLDVSIMANVWGTHSGWIEMCHDLGVRVVAPDIGFYAEQHEPVTYRLADEGTAIDPMRLADAIKHALALPAPQPASARERRVERDTVARAHAQIYRDVVARRRNA